ncbi:MAG: MASE3 domain-containing protein [Tissierellales bacterium]
MMIEKKKANTNICEYIIVIMLFIVNLVFLKVIGIFEVQIFDILSVDGFLTIHIALEFFAILIFLMTYVITYYTFNKNKRLRLLVYSNTFLVSSAINFLHTMSYKGMPFFFTASSAQKATNFWIISRLILSIGLFISAMIPTDKKTTLKNEYFQAGSLVLIAAIFYFVTYRQDMIPPMFIDGQGLTPLKVFLEFFAILILCIAIVRYIKDYMATGSKVFRIFYIGLCFSVFTGFAFTLYSSVYDTYNLIGHMFNIVSSFLIFKGIFSYNLDHPYDELDKANERISRYADNLEEIVAIRTEEIQAVNHKMMEDLDYAKRIQQSLLPPRYLNIYDTKFISEYIPCDKLSGDFYNIFTIDEENLAMYIADVSGHGVSAAVMTIFADRIMKPTNLINPIENVISPSQKLMNLYSEYNRSDFPDEMHIVIFDAIYNVKTKVLSYCSGGMNVLPILIRANGRLEYLNKSAGFPICKFGELYSPRYENSYVKLNSGDRIIFYTDGLVEHLKENSVLKKETVINIMKEYRHKSLNSLNDRILTEIIKYTGQDYAHDDDITYFIFEA